MMGRSGLPIGTWGTDSAAKDLSTGKWRAVVESPTDTALAGRLVNSVVQFVPQYLPGADC
jgi:hypothetical protein